MSPRPDTGRSDGGLNDYTFPRFKWENSMLRSNGCVKH